MIWGYDLAFAATAGAVFLSTGLYRGIWRYASLPDLLSLIKAASLVILIFFPLMFLATRLEELPRSLVGINWLLLVALLGGPRFAYRVYKDRNLDHLLERTSHVPIPVLVIGAREDADLFIRTTQRDPARVYRVVGLISDTAMRVGRDIGGVPVLGTLDDIAAVVTKLSRRDDRPQRIIISTRGLDGGAVRQPARHRRRARHSAGAAAAPHRLPGDARRDPPHRADRDRGSAGPAADRARPRQHEGAGRGTARARHRRGRHDRRRAFTPDRRHGSGAARPPR